MTLSVSHSPISWWCWDVINVTLADEDASKKIIYVEVGVKDGFGNCSMTAGNLVIAWQYFQSSATDWTFSGHRLKLVFRCASISWFHVVSQWVNHWCFSASASTGLSELFYIRSTAVVFKFPSLYFFSLSQNISSLRCSAANFPNWQFTLPGNHLPLCQLPWESSHNCQLPWDPVIIPYGNLIMLS